MTGFRQGLKETGYVDGQNMVIDFWTADDHPEKLPAIFDELIRRPVAVLVPANFGAAQAAKAATTTVPIVFVTGGDPAADDKLVSRFNRPGGNITGVTFLALGAKKLELLREVVPGTKVINQRVTGGPVTEVADEGRGARAPPPRPRWPWAIC